MKHFILPALFLVLTGCSTPKYTYRFAPSPYLASLSGDSKAKAIQEPEKTDPAVSSETQPVLVAAAETPASVIAPPEIPAGHKKKKVVRKLKEETKALHERVEAKVRAMDAPAPMDLDNDLKYAIILGSAGIVSLLLLVVSQVFGIIGGIALIGAVFFFARWVINQ